MENNSQRTVEWYAFRMGKITASEVYKLMGAKGFGDTGESYILEKVAQMHGAESEDLDTYAVKWGTALEPQAKEYFTMATGLQIEERSFVVADWCADAGCSPDGFIHGRHEGIEIKCPYQPVNHVKQMLCKTQDNLKIEFKNYYWQIQMSLAVTGFKSWYFVSYDPRFQGENRMYILKVVPNEIDISLLKERVIQAVELRNHYYNLTK